MKSYYAIVGVAVLLFSFALYFCTGEDDISVKKEPEKIIETSTKVDKIVVYLTGEVKDVGIYELDDGSRLYQLIDMAGGFKEGADVERVNLARFIFDGEQIHIYNKLREDADINTKVSINKADIKALSSLKGIGEGKADDIINYRRNNGPFKKLEDIMKVKGIKKSLFNKIKDDICL